MRKLGFLPILGLLLALSAQGAAKPATLFVTHASTSWDKPASAATGVRCTIDQALVAGIPRVYLVDQDPAPCEYYLKAYHGARKVISEGGEHSVGLDMNRVILTGGFFEGCLKNTLGHIFAQYPWRKHGPLHVYYVMDAVYRGRDDQFFTTLQDANTSELFLSQIGSGIFEPFTYIDHVYSEWKGYLTYNILRHGRPITTIGWGENQVFIDFITSSEVGALLK